MDFLHATPKAAAALRGNLWHVGVAEHDCRVTAAKLENLSSQRRVSCARTSGHRNLRSEIAWQKTAQPRDLLLQQASCERAHGAACTG